MDYIYLLAGLGVVLGVGAPALFMLKKKKKSGGGDVPVVSQTTEVRGDRPSSSESGTETPEFMGQDQGEAVFPSVADEIAQQEAKMGGSAQGEEATTADLGAGMDFDAAASTDDGSVSAAAPEEPEQEPEAPVYQLDDVPVQASVNVSYEEVDQLAEFNVYKQYGYFDQAAAALGEYLATLEEKPRELVWEYVGLYLEIGQIDDFVKALELVKNEFSKEETEEVVRLAFSIDPNNIPLRVFAERELGWSMNQIGKEVEAVDQAGQQDQGDQRADSGNQEDDFSVASGFAQGRQGASGRTDRSHRGRPLVQGYARIRAITKDEVGAIAGLAPETKAAKLLTPEVDYTYGCTLYNRAIAASQKPENIIVDAMMSDAKNQDIDNYARHLWNLYTALGRSGRDIKATMLSWGYSLGNHPLFQALESFPADLQLKELGLEYGFVGDTASQLKAKMKPLVNQSQDKRAKRVFDKVDEVLQEAETQLQYGQVDEAITTLEEGVMAHTQEPQLYSMLFDLYERSESWSRFKEFSVRIRNEISDLPEEVAVALSHVMQRMDAGGAA